MVDLETLAEDVPEHFERSMDEELVLLGKDVKVGLDFGWISDAHDRDAIPFQEGSNVRLKGLGKGLTIIKPDVPSDNATIQVGNVKNATLTIEGCTIYCGKRAAIHAGLEAPGYQGSLTLRLIDCEIVAEEPESGYGNTSVWGVFAYNLRLEMTRVTFKCKHLAEHAVYLHNGTGAEINRCEVEATGSEGFKFTCRDHEGASPPDKARIHIKSCTIAQWHQMWAWRGGAGIVIQGARMNILIEDCVLISPPNSDRCLMIDDGGDDRPTDGSSPNGWVIVRRTAITCPSGANGTNYPPMVRIGSLILGEDLSVVTGALFKNCGIWSKWLSLQISWGAVPAGRFRVQGCNTKFIKHAAQARGIWTGDEAQIPLHDRLLPISEGYEA